MKLLFSIQEFVLIIPFYIFQYINLLIQKNIIAMINKNVADYTNFGGNKTNKRIVQAPGGSSSISLGWGDNSSNQRNPRQYANNPHNYNQQSMKPPMNKYKQQQQFAKIGSMNNQYGYNNVQNNYQRGSNNNYSRQKNRNPIIGGQYGYNNYTPNSYNEQRFEQPNSQYQSQEYGKINHRKQWHEMGQQKVDPSSIYKPSTSSSSKKPQFDSALQEQKYRIQSRKMQRSNNNQYPPKGKSNYSKQQYPPLPNQNANQGRSCVKIHQQKQTSIFGGDYDYWKQDGHKQTATNRENKASSFSNHQNSNNIITNQNNQYNKKPYNQENGQSQKTNVKVHNPPGGKSNFVFG